MRLKRFLMASALALSFTATAPTAAKADPISAAVVAFVGFTGTAAAVATFVINTALYAAGSWAVTKAAKALGLMKSNVAERQATVTTLDLGETPREAVVGVACTGGSLIDAWNHGGKYSTDYVTRRVALGDHVLDGLVGYYVDDAYYSFAGNGVQPGFNGALQLTFVNATRDGVFPPPYMLQAGVGLTSADRCPSVAEVWITYKFDDQVWTRGHPILKFVVRGLRVYDARFDPQYGYTGPDPQTWGDVSTHRFSQNAAVVRYHIQRGVYAVGRHGELEHLLIGRGLSAAEAPAARIIAAANVCDEIVDGQPRYAVGGVVSSSQSHIEVEEMFAAAMAGQIVQRDGGVEVEPGQAKAAVVTITDADLVDGEAVSFDEFTPDTDGGRVNTVIARYVEPAQLYKDHSGSVLRNQADIVEDGGPRELTLPLMLVTVRAQADRCAEITRRAARLERRAEIVLVPLLNAGRAAAELEDGDIIAWRSDRYHDGATVRYRIETYGVDEGWRNALRLREMASSVFGQADPIEDRASPPPAPTPIDALQLLGVQAEPITLPGETATVPAVRFSWDVTTADTAMSAIRAEVRRVGETDAAPTRIDDVAKGQANVTNGVGPDQALECRLVPIGDPSRPVLASNWITVSTSTIVAGDLSPESPVRIAVTEITGRLVSVEQIAASNAAAVADLETVYDDTVSAAESALAAGQAANLVVLKAGEANDAAAASNVSAGVAGTKADEAGISAQASNAAKVAAEVARDGASGSAAASATNAAQALAYRDQAGEFASSSSGSANQAATSAGQSLAYRDQSASSAAAANAASVSAGVSASSAAASANNNFAVSPGLALDAFAVEQWSTLNATPDIRRTLTESPSQFSIVNGAYRVTNRGTIHIHAAKALGIEGGRRVRASTTFRRAVEGGTAAENQVTLFIWGWNAAGEQVDARELANINPGGGGVQSLAVDFTLAPAAVWVRAMVRIWSAVGSTEVLTVETRDIQSEAAASASAAAATSSAASAAGSAASASVSANLAARSGNSNPNMLANGGMVRGGENWGATPGLFVGGALPYQDNQWGPQLTYASTPFSNIQWFSSEIVAVSEGLTYTYSFDPVIFATANGAYGYLDVVALNSAYENAWIPGQTTPAIYANRDFSNNPATERAKLTVTFPTGLGITRAYFRWIAVPQPGSNVSAFGIRRAKLEFGSVATGYSAEGTDRAFNAQLNITAAVAADVATRMQSVQFSVTGGAGGDPFDISLKAGPTGSDASITATKVRLRNIVNGESVEALRIENGKSKFFGDVEVNGGSMNFNNRFIVAQDGTTAIRSGQTGERMWIEGKTIRGWYANGQQAYQLG